MSKISGMDMDIELANGSDINKTEEFIDAAYKELGYNISKNKMFNDLKVELKHLSGICVFVE